MDIAMMVIGAFIIGITFLIGIFIDKMNKNSVFFGVRIPIGYEKRDDLLKLKKKYKINFTITTLIFLCVYLILIGISSLYSPFVLILGMYIYIGLMQWNFYLVYKKVKLIKKSEQWVLESTNKVVVDLKYRNKNEKQKVSISLIWYIVPFIIVYFSFILSFESNMVILAVSEATITIISILSTIIMVRSKQNINGGDVNKVKEQTKRIRYKISKAFYFLCIMTNLLFLVVIALYKYEVESPAIWGTIFMSFFILSFAIVIYLIHINKEKKTLQEDMPDSMVINREDDDNYLLGNIYYNKYDPAVFVEKRVGIGTTFNFATLPAKIFMGIMSLILFGTLVLMLFIPFTMKESEVTFKQDSINISGIYGTEIKYSDINSIKLGDKIEGNMKLFKTNGCAMENIDIGHFNIKGLGKARLFIMNSEKIDVEMKLKDGTYLMINYEDINKTKSLYEKLEGKVKK